MISDIAHRQAALDPTRSFAVAAPAGSGKTELLTQRVLTLLARVEKPEEILCITFTRKAAAEMHARLLDALNLAKEAMPEEPHKKTTWQLARQALEQDANKEWHLLEHPSRLKILTIDGLCHLITQQMPALAGFGSSVLLSNQPQRLYELAVEKFFQHLEDEHSTFADHLAYLIRHLDNDLNRLQRLLVTLLDQRSQWLPYLIRPNLENRENDTGTKDYLENTLSAVVEEQLQQCEKLCHEFKPGLLSELADILDYATTQLKSINPDHPLCQLHQQSFPDAEAQQLPAWQAIAQWLLTSKGEWRSRFTKKEGIPAVSHFKDRQEKAVCKQKKAQLDEIMSSLKGLKSTALLKQWGLVQILPTPQYPQRQWELLDALTHVLPLLVAELSLVFQQFGEVDFTAVTHGALQALGDEDAPTELALKLDYRIQHILVDEYQDTSTVQLELLEKLTAGWQHNDGRTVFIVGDGMQSCYGFRDANVGIFLSARQKGVGDIPLTALDLTANFRSQQGIIEWINTQFQASFSRR